MDLPLLLEQTLHGVQLGAMLFLMAAGLTLVFGIMNVINLAHGSLYMMGAFFAASLTQWTGSFVVGLLLGTAAAIALGIAVELIALRTLYDRDHLDQVLATFGLILFFNELVNIVWGVEPFFLNMPGFLSGTVEILPGVPYPAYRLAITATGIAVGAFLYLLIVRTRIGMLIRAGASNREMVSGLGVNVRLLCTFVFGLGAGLAGLAGIITGPLFSIQTGMGEPILILTFVVIVIGGIGSIRGAAVASILVGFIDTIGRYLLPQIFGFSIGPALASMAIYALMAAVLIWRPQGLFALARG